MDNSIETNQSRFIARKKKELQDAEAAADLEKARSLRAKASEAAAAKEKGDKEVVAISKAGEKQAELARTMNSERVRTLSENHSQNYQKLADSTAAEIKRLDTEALKAIEGHKAANMERIRSITEQEDPFYRIKSLSPTLSENDKEYVVKVAVPEHEAKNLFISGEGQALKLSLGRRFQDQTRNEEESRVTKTSSYQTVVETLVIPGPYDAKKIHREYADGFVTIKMPKPAPAGLGDI